MPPKSAHFVAVDFEKDSQRARLKAEGFDERVPTVTAWLGVVPYLTTEGFSRDDGDCWRDSKRAAR